MRNTCPKRGTPSSPLTGAPAIRPPAGAAAARDTAVASRTIRSGRLAMPHCPAEARLVQPGSAAVLHLPLDLALGVTLREVAALVARFLASRERDLDLHASVLEVELRGDECQAPLLHLAEQHVDLAPAQQELAVAVGV